MGTALGSVNIDGRVAGCVRRDLGREEAAFALAISRGIGRRVGEELDRGTWCSATLFNCPTM